MPFVTDNSNFNDNDFEKHYGKRPTTSLHCVNYFKTLFQNMFHDIVQRSQNYIHNNSVFATEISYTSNVSGVTCYH